MYQRAYSGPNSQVYLTTTHVRKIVPRFSDLTLNIDGIREAGIVTYLNAYMRHSGIITFLDMKYLSEGAIIDMPRATCDLAAFLRSHKTIPIDQKNKFGDQIIDAVRFCHSLNVMHRDIKPQNILLYSLDRLVLTDFGAARLVTSSLDQHLTSDTCTLFYRAPEILLNTHYDFTADIWSLGCTLAEIYLGKPLFRADRVDKLHVLRLIVKYRGLPENLTLRQQILSALDLHEGHKVKVRQNMFFPINMQNSGRCGVIKKMLRVDPLERFHFDLTSNNIVASIWPKPIPVPIQRKIAGFVEQHLLGFDCYWLILHCLAFLDGFDLITLYAVLILVVKAKLYSEYNFAKLVPSEWRERVILRETLIAPICSNIIILPTPLELLHEKNTKIDNSLAVKTLTLWIRDQMPTIKTSARMVEELNTILSK